MMSRADAERSELWLESVERYHERQRQEHRARWYAFHANMSELHARLSEEHAQKAEALCCDDGSEADLTRTRACVREQMTCASYPLLRHKVSDRREAQSVARNYKAPE